MLQELIDLCQERFDFTAYQALVGMDYLERQDSKCNLVETIPAHWTPVRLKFKCQTFRCERTGYTIPIIYNGNTVLISRTQKVIVDPEVWTVNQLRQWQEKCEIDLGEEKELLSILNTNTNRINCNNPFLRKLLGNYLIILPGNDVNRRWLAYFLESTIAQNWLARESGCWKVTDNRNLTQKVIGNLPLFLPSLDEQEDIVDRLDKAKTRNLGNYL